MEFKKLIKMIIEKLFIEIKDHFINSNYLRRKSLFSFSYKK